MTIDETLMDIEIQLSQYIQDYNNTLADALNMKGLNYSLTCIDTENYLLILALLDFRMDREGFSLHVRKKVIDYLCSMYISNESISEKAFNDLYNKRLIFYAKYFNESKGNYAESIIYAHKTLIVNALFTNSNFYNDTDILGCKIDDMPIISTSILLFGELFTLIGSTVLLKIKDISPLIENKYGDTDTINTFFVEKLIPISLFSQNKVLEKQLTTNYRLYFNKLWEFANNTIKRNMIEKLTIETKDTKNIKILEIMPPVECRYDYVEVLIVLKLRDMIFRKSIESIKIFSIKSIDNLFFLFQVLRDGSIIKYKNELRSIDGAIIQMHKIENIL